MTLWSFVTRRNRPGSSSAHSAVVGGPASIGAASIGEASIAPESIGDASIAPESISDASIAPESTVSEPASPGDASPGALWQRPVVDSH